MNTSQNDSLFYYFGWVPFFNSAVLPITRDAKEISDAAIPIFLKENGSDAVSKLSVEQASSFTNYMKYSIRNDGLLVFSFSTSTTLDDKQRQSIALVIFEAIKRRANHRNLFHGSGTGINSAPFQPVQILNEKNIWELFSEHEKIESMMVNGSPTVPVFIRYRENFGRAASSLLDSRERIRQRVTLSNIPLYFVSVLLCALLAPALILWAPTVTPGKVLFIAVILPFALITVLSFLDPILKYFGKFKWVDKFLMQRLVRKVLIPIVTLLFTTEYTVWLCSTNPNEVFGGAIFSLIHDRRWSPADKTLSLIIVVGGILILWSVEVFFKRNYILKTIEYAKGTLIFGSIYSRLVENIAEKPAHEFDLSTQLLDTLKIHEVRKLWNAHIAAALSIIVATCGFLSWLHFN
jgi:hypothetical protein